MKKQKPVKAWFSLAPPPSEDSKCKRKSADSCYLRYSCKQQNETVVASENPTQTRQHNFIDALPCSRLECTLPKPLGIKHIKNLVSIGDHMWGKWCPYSGSKTFAKTRKFIG
jgi:hypothetical protein